MESDNERSERIVAYYDRNGTITIDENAARRDIQKIEAALPSLRNAKSALERMLEEGGQTKGDTGNAIIEKSQELLSQTNKMIKQLEETKSLIEKVVRHYQKLDAEMKRLIDNASL